MKRKNILILMGMNDSIDRLNTIINFAKKARWDLTIEDRYNPPETVDYDGILATLVAKPDLLRFIRKALAKGIPVVDMHDEVDLPGLYRVAADFTAAGRRIAEHLTTRGFRQVAWFSTDSYHMHEAVKAGFSRAWRGTEMRDWTYRKSARNPSVERWMAEILSHAPKPIAVLTFNNYNAVKLLNGCQTANLAVPDDLSIISSNNEAAYLDKANDTTISYVRFDYSVLGQKAAETLDAILSRAKVKTATLTAPVEIVIGRSSNTYTAGEPRVRQALLYIRDNLSKPFTIADIAEHVKAPRITLDRLFRAEFGRTTGKELLRLRLSEAKRLLASTDMKLEAISAATGFCHASYLIKAFKRNFGLTPNTFRERTAAT